ncbi:MAG: asparagine synthase C-terminal domain-containing protein [Lachnospiraceae bacterium]|nr:asparagine synthase C-terminal domain-containing protein [Lachnospiraceae bacterium]
MPSEIKTRHYTTKYVLRKAASHYIPKETAYRKKLGFPVPIRNWIKEDDWYEQIKEPFIGETASTYFHTKYLLKLLEEHRANREDNSKKFGQFMHFWYGIRYFLKKQELLIR